jgi:putative ABC transport system permease protein
VNWGRNLKLSVRALSRARARTLLSASSMMIGIAAITLLFGVAAGAEKAYQAALESVGKNLLSVGSQRKQTNALRGDSLRYETLTLNDTLALANEIDGVTQVAPIILSSFELRFGGKSVNMTVFGTTPGFQITNNQPLQAGRFIDAFDVRDVSRVAVIGSQVEKKLFSQEPALGKRLLVGGAPYIVIGVLQEKGVDLTGSPQDDRILIPVTTAQQRLLNIDSVDRIFIQVESKQRVPEVVREIRGLLRERHGLAAAIADDFTVRDQASLVAMQNKTDRSLSRFLAGIATLTLGLASVGLLAVSLLSVRERQGEIGLRLAVGALPRHILMQFLSETVMIALIGLLAGLIVGSIGIVVGDWLLNWQLVVNGKGVLYTFMVSLLLSLLFGTYPALRAARLNPITALRGT